MCFYGIKIDELNDFTEAKKILSDFALKCILFNEDVIEGVFVDKVSFSEYMDEFIDTCRLSDFFELFIDERYVHIIYDTITMNQEIVIGRKWHSIKDNETGKEFKDFVEENLIKLFFKNVGPCSTIKQVI